MKQPARNILATLGVLALTLAVASGLGAMPALSLGWYGAEYCDDAEASNPGVPGGCRYAAESNCADGVDGDSDERTDCLDPDCLAPGSEGARICAGACEGVPEICGDGIDQDCDGRDATCGCQWWEPWCQEGSCGDGICSPAGGESCGACPSDCGSCEALYIERVSSYESRVVEPRPTDSVPADIVEANATFTLHAAEDVWVDGDPDDLYWQLDSVLASTTIAEGLIVPLASSPEDATGGDDRRFRIRAGESRDFAFAARAQAPVTSCATSSVVVYGIRWGAEPVDRMPNELSARLYFPFEPLVVCPRAAGESGALCLDGVDNDADGKTDCADPDCAGVTVPRPGYAQGILCEPAGETTCSDGWDNDNDGRTDCYDKTNCSCAVYEHCFNGLDDDGDGLVDCADWDCEGPQGQEGYECQPGAEGICDDGFDNDGNGLVDCADANCGYQAICGYAEIGADVELVSVDQTRTDGVSPGEADQVEFRFKYRVTAKNEDLLIAGVPRRYVGNDELKANVAGGVMWATTTDTTATSTGTAVVTASGSTAGDRETPGGHGYLVRDGETRNFTLTVVLPASSDNTVAAVRLMYVPWSTLGWSYPGWENHVPLDDFQSDLVTGLYIR